MTAELQFAVRFPGAPEGIMRNPESWLAWRPNQAQSTGPAWDDWRPDPWATMDAFIRRSTSRYVGIYASYDLARWAWEGDPSLRRSGQGFPDLLLASFQRSARQGSDRTGTFQLGPLRDQMGARRYRTGIQQIKQSIRDGDVYQVNFSRRYEASCNGRLIDLLTVLPGSLTPPMTAYLRFRDRELLSLSPERYVRVEDRSVRTEPIKGTRPRSGDPQLDRTRACELTQSEKDQAEHAMIVDLERNDLNRVCRPETVRVPAMARLRSFPTVHHLVSTVAGRLRSDVSLGDLFRATFPGGSITGAPKSTALRLIDDLEPIPRGPYTGSLGLLDREQGWFDSNLLIRTLVREGSTAWWNAGGGVVIDSEVQQESDECEDKVRLLSQLRQRNLIGSVENRGVSQEPSRGAAGLG